MNTVRICQNCRKPLAPDSPMGLCPECLIKSGFPSGVETETESGSRSAFVPPTVEEIAKLFPQLEILGLLGKGGMGAVYKARQKQLNRVVALKILPPGIGTAPAFAQRFTREAQAMAQLNHPGIVTLYEFGDVGELRFFLMEFVDGVNLRQLLENGRISSREALSIVPQICDALQFAHDQGIVHRDIKPENILLDRRGRVKVADFGLALLADKGLEPSPGAGLGLLAGAVALTETGKVVGTPRYMAPEQVERPGEVDHRADIYALGVVFYQMLTGDLPGKRIEPPSKKVQMDVRLDEVVLRALEQKPERRYQQVSELKTSVEAIASPSERDTKSAGLGAGRSLQFGRPLLLGLVALVVAFLALAFVNLKPRMETDRGTPTDPGPNPGPGEVLRQTIRHEVGRQLREAGATYDDLQVTVAEQRESATPFRVAYSGLSNFKGSDGTVPEPHGSFVMEYIGGGQWQGMLAGTRLTVSAGSKDQIDLPFVDDPRVIGEWKSVDFVPSVDSFEPGNAKFKGELFLKGQTFLKEGKTPQLWLTWTKGVLIHHGDQTASHYEIREINGNSYLFLEWKSGDVTIAGQKPWYYVLRKAP